MTTYKISGYGYGSTNGATPVGFAFVTGAATKKEAVEAGLKVLGCRKALGFKIGGNVAEAVATTKRLYANKPVHEVTL